MSQTKENFIHFGTRENINSAQGICIVYPVICTLMPKHCYKEVVGAIYACQATQYSSTVQDLAFLQEITLVKPQISSTCRKDTTRAYTFLFHC